MITSLPACPVPATIAAARVFLDAALREEGAALAAACSAANVGGAPGSLSRLEALRLAEAAHARSTTAICMLRALNDDAERIDAATRMEHAPA